MSRTLAIAVSLMALTACSGELEEAETPASEPLARAWKTVSTKGEPTARHEAAMVAHGGKAILLGGRRVNPVEVFDPIAGSWQSMQPTPMEMHHFQPVSFGDLIYVMTAMTGQYPKETPLETIYVYDPAVDTWTKGPEVPVDRRRGGAGTVVREGKIYVACGIIDGHTSGTVPWFDEFDPATGTWRQLPDAPRARDHFSAVVLDDRLYLVGGRDTSYHEPDNFTAFFDRVVREVDVYDFAIGTWSTLPDPLPVGTAAGGLVALDGSIFYFGGESGQDLAHSQTQVLDPESGAWTLGPPLNVGRHGGGSAVIDNRIYVATGSGGRGGGPELASIEMLALQP